MEKPNRGALRCGACACVLYALDTDNTWTELLPAVYGTSVTKYETGWQHDLTVQVG